jgi:hypothetical protein
MYHKSTFLLCFDLSSYQKYVLVANPHVNQQQTLTGTEHRCMQAN